MIGDETDIVGRLTGYLPRRWFLDGTPSLISALATGAARALASVHDQIEALRADERIATASGDALDTIASDFLGDADVRRSGQSDNAYRRSVLARLLTEKATRAGLNAALSRLTGSAPRIVEPLRPLDTGAYGAGRGYGTGAYGSTLLEFQVFVTAVRQPTYASGAAPWGRSCSAGGYGRGALVYASAALGGDAVQDGDIYALVEAVRPIGCVLWVRIVG